jgi:hypothetical protein
VKHHRLTESGTGVLGQAEAENTPLPFQPMHCLAVCFPVHPTLHPTFCPPSSPRSYLHKLWEDPNEDLDERVKRLRQAVFKQEYKARQHPSAQQSEESHVQQRAAQPPKAPRAGARYKRARTDTTGVAAAAAPAEAAAQAPAVPPLELLQLP